MNLALKVIVPVGGVTVLGSYVWGLRKEGSSQLWGALDGPMKPFWILSALLTALSFLYLWYVWVWQESSDHLFLLLTYAVFLLSASLWMWCTWQVISGDLSRVWLTLNLWTTALASFGFAIYSIWFPISSSSAQQLWVQACACMLVIQHVFWDAIVWNATFLP
jgi:hypothetical protein